MFDLAKGLGKRAYRRTTRKMSRCNAFVPASRYGILDLAMRLTLSLTLREYRGLSRYNASIPSRRYSFLGRLKAVLAVQEVNSAWRATDVPKLRMLKNIHSDEDRCFIIGNGPSVNSMDLTKLKDEITFGVNAVFLNFDKMGFSTTYYVVEDDLVAEDRAGSINNLKGMTKFFPIRLAYCIDRDEKTIFLNHCPDNTHGYQFSADMSQFTCGGSTVVYTCMQIAFYMGFKTVYLIGVDHDYAIPKSYEKYDSDLNYVIESLEDDPNHFDKDYFGKGFRWHNPKVHLMAESFQRANEMYERCGRMIYNATVGGKLEIFKRVNYEDLFLIKSSHGRGPKEKIS